MAAGKETNTANTNTDANKTMEAANLQAKLPTTGQDEAFIGGGCCVHLSVEFMPIPATGTTPGAVLVSVVDSEETVLQWMKIVQPGSGYKIKEAIISTNPGAILHVAVLNVTARVRWCEVFSC